MSREETIKRLAKEARKVIREAGISVSNHYTDEEVLKSLCPSNRIIFEEAMNKLAKIEDELAKEDIYL